MTLIENFLLDLRAFSELTDARATAVVRATAAVCAEAIIIGNEYGPGAPVDTGWLRASFQVTLNTPATGPSEPPPRPKGRRLEDPPLYPDAPVLTGAENAALSDVVYITTPAAYAEYLEYDGLERRFGPYRGMPTAFVRSVALRFDRIVDDVRRRLVPDGAAA